MARPETPEQKRAFEVWYENDRKFRTTSQNLALNIRTLYDWACRYDWEQRADERDAKAHALVEQEAIESKTKRLKEHLQFGTALRVRASQYIGTNEITCYKDALAAGRLGIEIERSFDDLPSLFLGIANASTLEELEAIENAIQANNATQV